MIICLSFSPLSYIFSESSLRDVSRGLLFDLQAVFAEPIIKKRLTPFRFRVKIKKKRRKPMKKYRCKVCGEVFEVAEGETPVCPLCGVDGDDLELIEE